MLCGRNHLSWRFQTGKKIICYYQGGKFYSDVARTQLLYNHPGNVVSKDLKPAYGTGLYRLMGNRIYKGFSVDKKDCLGTLIETKTQRGNVLEAVIYDGFVTFKDTEEKREAGGITIITEYNVLKDLKYVPGEVLYTIKNNKIYRGNSTDAKDCLLKLHQFPATVYGGRINEIVFLTLSKNRN